MLRLTALLAALWLASAPASAEPLKLGIHPYLPASELVDRFTPLARYLEERLDRPVEITIASTYEAHVERIANDEVSIAFLGPVSYVNLVEDHGAPPALAVLEIAGRTRFHGVIVTREASGLRTLADLPGTRFAFGDPYSTMGYVVPRHVMQQHGVRLQDLGGHDFLNSHDNVALGVLIGRYDAGAVKDETFDKYRPRGLRALAVTPETPEHIFVAAYRTKPALVAALREALLALPQSAQGAAILRAIKPDLTGLAPARVEDYDALRIMARATRHADRGGP